MPLRELRNTVTLHQQIKPDSLCIIMASEDPSKLKSRVTVFPWQGFFAEGKNLKRIRSDILSKLSFN